MSDKWYSLSQDTKHVTVLGLIVGSLTIVGLGVISGGSGTEAFRLLGAMLPSVRFFTSAIMTATASVLALMLTMLAFGQRIDDDIDTRFYERIQRIAYLDTVVFIGASFLLLLVSFPILEESDFFSNRVYLIFYYVLFIYTGVLWGMLALVILMLLNALKSLIHLLHPEKETEFLRDTVKES